MLFETKVTEYDKSMKNVKRNEQSEIIKDTKAKAESESLQMLCSNTEVKIDNSFIRLMFLSSHRK
jgi:hypothetical protein